mgnify:FL=1
MAPTPADIIKKIKASAVFEAWKKKHPKGYLSHFFCPITVDCELKSAWEVGFYDQNTGKMTVFAYGEQVTVKENEDDVFKKPEQTVEELKIPLVSILFPEAVDVFAEHVEELFPKAGRGDGFVILQTTDGKTLWNFTFITKSLKFINIKVNAETGTVESHLDMDLIDRGK